MKRISWLLIVPLLLAAVSAPVACVEFQTFTFAPGDGGTGGMAGASSSTSSTTSSTSSGGMAGTGGTGGSPDCTTPGDCVVGECDVATACNNGVCVVGHKMDGDPADSQLYGDCKDRKCDGNGAVKLVDGDMSKDAYDWANPCYVKACDANLMPMATTGAMCTTPWGVPSGKCDSFRCIECTMDAECGTEKCVSDRCIPVACTDLAIGGTETDTDCGGPDCLPCVSGKICMNHTDCEGTCDSTTMLCVAPSCADGVRNSGEADIDCGGSCNFAVPSKKCAALKKCLFPNDCESGVCKIGECQPASCIDATQNQEEVGSDCGGPCPAPCPSTP